MAEERELELKPDFTLTDFEKRSDNAVKSEFPSAQSKGWHFHLGQSVYRQIQDAGLTKKYGTDQNFSLLVRHIPALSVLYQFVATEFVSFNSLRVFLIDEGKGEGDCQCG